MKKSKISILLLVMVMILAISAVSAADNDDTSDSALQAVEEAPVDEVSSEDVGALAATDDADVLAADGEGTNFTSLQNKIDSSNTICYIMNDYTRTDGDDVVTISKDISIVSRGGNFKIDANNKGGIFKINPGVSVFISGLTLVNGNSDYGAAIYNEGDLVVDGCTLYANNASEKGGAIYNVATLDVSDSTFTDNTATYRGGAIYNEGNLKVTESTFDSNDISYRAKNDDNGGAAIYNLNGEMIIEDSFIVDNIKDFVISSGNSGDLIVAAVVTSGETQITRSYFARNCGRWGGAISSLGYLNTESYTLTVKDSEFEGNNATFGGAIFVEQSSLIVDNSTFKSNSVLGSGSPGTSNTQGGAIVVHPAGSHVTITDSTFTGNHADTGGAVSLAGVEDSSIEGCTFTDNVANDGGAVFLWTQDDATVTIADSTFSGNTANFGKAISNDGTLSLSNNTIVGDGADIESYYGQLVSAINVVIMDNGTYDCYSGTQEVFAKVTDDNNNLIIARNTIKFVTDGAEAAAIYNAADKLYYANLTLPSAGIYTVNIAYVDEDEITVKTATINNFRGTFQDLQNTISNAIGTTLDLEYDYKYVEGLDDPSLKNGVLINRGIEIRGNGHTISGSNVARIFNVTKTGVYITNMTIRDGSADKGAGVYVKPGVVFDATGVNFLNNTATYRGGAIYTEGLVVIEGCVIDGNDITFRSANDDNGGAAVYNNGGILYINNTDITNNLKDIVIRDGNDGHLINGAIVSLGGAVTINNSYIANNTGSWGAGVYVNADSDLEVYNTVFEANNATFGSAIYDEGAPLKVDNCIFNDNAGLGIGSPGTESTQGAAILVMRPTATATITNSKFNRNTARTGGAVSISRASGVSIDNCEFINNTAYYEGGAIYNYATSGSTLTLSNSYFSGNTAGNWGNAISNDADLALSNNTIIGDGADIGNWLGEVISEINIIILENQTVNATYGDTVEITAVVTDDNGNVMNDKNIKFTINDSETIDAIYYTDLGKYLAEYTPASSGTYIVGVDYPTTNELIVKKATIEVENFNVSLTVAADDIVEGENATINVYVQGENDIKLNTTVKVVVNDTEYTVDITDGEGNLTVSGLESGSYAIFAIFGESGSYNTVYDSYTFYVKHATTLVVSAEEEFEYGSDVIINFELDAIGQSPIFLVISTIDEELYTVVVNNGNGTLTISDLPVGNYTVTSYFNGDNVNNYTEGNEVQFKVVKGTPEITADVKVDNALYPGSIIVTINGPDGDYTITVGNKTVSVTVTGGTTSEIISDLAVGTQTATVEFAGNENCTNASITTESFTIIPSSAEISASAANVWIGNDATVIVTVPSDAQGKVTITVNGKKYEAEIAAGSATATISADDLVAGENAIDVTFAGDDNYAAGFNSTTVFVLDGVITNATYANYFDASGNLVSIVPNEVTLDFQGLFLGKYPVYINKAVNVISSTGDALFDCGASYAGNNINSFNMIAGSDHSNITGLKFINYCLYIKGASYITVDNISIVANKRGVGSGTGFLSIHTGAYYTTIKNSYFENGGTGSSCVVLGKGGKYGSFDNNVFNITGSSGNILSCNGFVGTGEIAECVNYTNNYIISNVGASSAMYGMAISGSGNIIENNTLINFKGNAVTNSFGATSTKNIYRNNIITGGGTMAIGTYSLVENNYIEGVLTLTAGCNATGNTAPSLTISGANVVAVDNIIKGTVTISGANVQFNDNIVTGTVTVNSNGNTLTGNNITSTGTYAVSINNARSDNTVTGNTLIANGKYGDVAVSYNDANNNVVENNLPVAEIEIDAPSVWIGNDNTITVTIVNGTGSVTIKVNDKEYTVDLTDGVASQEFAAEDFIPGVNDVIVTYNGGSFIPAEATATFRVIDGIITNDTFFDYFTEDGILSDAVPEGAELTFVGEFSNLTTTAVITTPVTIKGDNAVINNMAFSIWADDVTLTNMTFVATTSVGDLIGINANGVTVSNLDITYTVGDESAIAINAVGVEDVTIFNNTIVFESHASQDGKDANAINLDTVTNAIVDANKVTASITGVDADYGRSGLYHRFGMMGVNTVNPIRIVECEAVEFTNNEIDASLNDVKGYYPTVQSVLVVGSTDLVFDSNNFTMIDTFTPVGSPSYLYAFTFGVDDEVTVSNNNFYLETEGGANGLGTAYALQIVSSTMDIIGNNITSVSNGPNLGIYAVMEYNTFDNDFELTIKDNNLNITGYATGKSTSALVSGMEIGAGESDISGNTIYVYNKAGYQEGSNVYGISYVQSVYTPTLNIVDNEIYVEDGDYAISVQFSRAELTATDNTLVAHERYGDKAVSTKASGAVIEDNTPLAEIAIEAANVWIGDDATITVTIPKAVGNVTITVNGKEESVELVDGVATLTVGADDLLMGENTVDVTYDDISYSLATNSTTFQVLDGVITNATYAYYFDASGNLVSIVPNEVTLDFQGLFLGKYPVYINKAVNVISSTGDALFDCGNTYTSNDVNSFNFIAGSDHSNITGLKFMNYCLYIKGASYITVDSVSIVANKGGVGRGTGFLSIHSNAYYALVKNCYMENGGTGSSLLVLGKGGAYVVFDHNYFNITGNSGNVISANQFVGTGDAPEHTTYTNNIIYSARPASAICYAMTVSGSGNLLENNTIYFNGSGILNQYGASSVGNVYRNNTIYGSATFNPSANSLVENNKVYGTGKTTIAAGTTLINNTFNTVTISGANVVARENTFNQDFTISGAGTQLIGNIVTGTVTVSSNDNVIILNNITATGDYAVNLNAKTGNTVTGNILIAKEYYGDAAVKYTNENNVVEDNYPMDIDMIVSAEPIFVGQDAEITISALENFNGIVTVLVNGQTETVSLTNGKGNLIVSGLPAANHTVTVSFDGNAYFNADKANTTLVVSKVESEMNITVGEVAIDKDLEVTISLPGVTDEVTVIVDGNIATVNLVDGVGTFTVPKANMTAGDHTIIAIFEGNDQYDATVADANFTVEKEDDYEFDVNLTVDEIDYGEDVSFNVTLPEDANGRLIVSVDDEEVAWADVVNGTATVTIPADAFETGDNEISVTYSDDKYGETTVYEDIYVNELIADLSASANNISIGETAVITVSIPGAEDDTYLTVILLGVEYDVWLVDGQGSVTIPGLSEGSYTATVILEDDPVYEDASVEVTFNVSKVAVPADAINATTPENATAPVFTVTLPEDATGYLLLDVNGSQTHVPLVNGAASVAVPSNLAPGNYSATVTYTGDDKYAPVTTTKEISVASNVPDSALTIPEDSNTTTPTYAINLPADAGGYLEVDVDGTKYVAPLVNGSASITVPELSEGKHNVTVTYTGDDKYTKVVKSNTLNVNSSASTPVYQITENKDVSAIYSATSSYKVLVTKDGKAVGAGESVTFTFNGKKSTVKTDSKGYATLKLNTKVKVKSYTVTAEYNGVKVTNKVTIKHVIKAKNKKVKKSKKVTKVKITLKKVNGKVLKAKKLKVKFRGKKYTVKTNKKGVATWKVKKSMLKKLKVGKKYKYKVTYGKDVVTKKLTIKK